MKGLPPHAERRSHHLHITLPGGRYDDRLRFRDRLRADAVIAQRYAVLKQELAARFSSDREAYTRAKTEFILTVLHGSANSF